MIMYKDFAAAGEFWLEYNDLKQDGWIELRIPTPTVDTEVIEDWLTKNPCNHKFIKHTENKGVCKAYNSGITNASGKYLMVIDTDDVLESEKLVKDVKILESSSEKVGLVYSDASIIDENGEFIQRNFIRNHRPEFREMPSGNVYHVLLQGNYIPSMTPLIKKAVFNEIGIYDESLAYEDYDMWLRIAQKYEFLFSDFVSISYRVRGGSLSQTLRDWDFSDASIFLKHVGAPIPIKRIIKIAMNAYSKNDEKTLQVIRKIYSGTKYPVFKAIWILWKHKVPADVGELIVQRVEQRIDANASGLYIRAALYKDVYEYKLKLKK
jgi:glycosyltransferase involved in cell wall biosynthesis